MFHSSIYYLPLVLETDCGGGSLSREAQTSYCASSSFSGRNLRPDRRHSLFSVSSLDGLAWNIFREASRGIFSTAPFWYRKAGAQLRVFPQMTKLPTLSLMESPPTLQRKLILTACICNHNCLLTIYPLWPKVKEWPRKMESFTLQLCSLFTTTEQHRVHNTVEATSIRLWTAPVRAGSHVTMTATGPQLVQIAETGVLRSPNRTPHSTIFISSLFMFTVNTFPPLRSVGICFSSPLYF